MHAAMPSMMVLTVISALPRPVAAIEESVPPTVRALGITADDWHALSAGEAVVRNEARRDATGSPAARIAGYVVVRAPWRPALEIIGQHEKQPEFSTCLRNAETLVRTDGPRSSFMKVRETHQYAWMTVRYTLDYTHDYDAREIRFALDPDAQNDVAAYDGAWRFVEIAPDVTLIAYEVTGVSAGWLLRPILDYFARSRLGTLLSENVKKRVESGGVWVPR